MYVIDQIASIPYRLFGVIRMILSIIAFIPTVLIPAMFEWIINREIHEYIMDNSYDISKNIDTIEEYYELLLNMGLVGKLAVMAISNFIKGFMMTLGGIYWEEAYYMLMTDSSKD